MYHQNYSISGRRKEIQCHHYCEIQTDLVTDIVPL